MLNRDRPLGQRKYDGFFFGDPYAPRPKRASYAAPGFIMREQFGWRDRIGMPHGRSGDKLVRKAMRGTVGLSGGRRGPLDGRPMPARYPFSAKRA